MGPMGSEIIPELRLSGYPSSRPIMKADTSAVNQGWAMFVPDLTSSVGPWGVSFSAEFNQRRDRHWQLDGRKFSPRHQGRKI